MGSPIMCDWVTASVISENVRNHVSPGFDTGRFVKVKPGGEIEQEFSSRLAHPGSFDSGLSFRAPSSHQLEMSGNPVKFIQGHNLFGSDDFVGLFFTAGLTISINQDHSVFPVPIGWHSNLSYNDGSKPPLHQLSEPKFTRLDLTRSYRFDSNAESRAWLRGVGASGHSRHRVKNNLMNDGTVYFGKNSTRWSFKIYQKFDEISSKKKGHELSYLLPEVDRAELTAWSEGVVRFELTLRRPEIEKLSPNFNSLDVWSEYYGRIQFNDNARGAEMITSEKLTKNQMLIVESWLHGRDLRAHYTKPTFYRVRKQILDAIAVDIATAPVQDDVAIVVTALKATGWDPDPIERLNFSPEDWVKKAYGF